MRKILSTLFLFLPFHFIYAQNIHISEDSLILTRAQRLFESGRYDSSVLVYQKYLSMITLSGDSSSIIPDQETKTDIRRYLKVLLRLGTSYNMISDPENALSVLNSGIKLVGSEAIDEPVIKALLFYQAGNAYLLKTDYKNSIRSYQNALALAGNDDVMVMKINQNLGGIFFFMEDYDKAIEHYQKALVINSASMSAGPLITAELLINTGSAFVEKNEFIRAEEYFSKAENLFKRVNKPDLHKQARLSLSLGNLYMKMNNTNGAYCQFMKASQLYHLEMPSNPDELILLYTNLAQLSRKQLVFDSAIYYYNLAVSLFPDTSERYSLILANLYHNIGETYGMQKNRITALNYYQKALEILMPADLNFLTTLSFKSGNPARALELLRIGMDKARTLYRLGLDIGSDDIILQSFNEYLSAIESVDLINKEFEREGSRLLFNESVKDLYYGALETGYHLSTRNHKEFEEQLFLVNEKSRNKILRSGFMDHIAKRVSGIPDSLMIREKVLNNEISLCIKNLLIDPPEFVNDHQDNYLFYLNNLIGLRREIDSLQLQYEHSTPVYSRMKEQETASTYTKIQQQLLPGEALLEYFIGDTSLFIFVARSDSLIIRRIPVSSYLYNELSKFSKEIRLAEQQNFYESGHDLYCKLILPVKASLVHIKKLIIIPDENLATIPFEVLISDHEKLKNNSSYDHHSYLLNNFEISYHFSSALWISSRQEERIDFKSLDYAGFAPVNFSSDKTVNTSGNNKISFSSLPSSKKEIQDISDLVLKNGGETHLFLGQEATEKNFRDSVEDCSIIHIATHSLINDRQPGHSGLVFFPDKNEEKDNSIFEGILYLEEIFNLSITADLLVLSACATGTGKVTRSEGVLAMTRGFFTAGASNIVYTLWNVTDKHTREFMVSFFEGILSGQTYSSALRNAKLEMISKPETSLPRMWAPYLLLGN